VPLGSLPSQPAERADPGGMTTLVRRSGALAAISVALVGGVVLGSSPVSAATSTNASYEARVVKLTNDARVKKGCAIVRTDTRLGKAARAHSVDMATKNYFSHVSKDGSSFIVRAKRAGYTSPIGENIAWGYRTPEAVMTGWMNSSGHRANILNCKAKAVGVGLAKKADGTPYWTQVFGSA
jgi:uncharacterized protein YkwD